MYNYIIILTYGLLTFIRMSGCLQHLFIEVTNIINNEIKNATVKVSDVMIRQVEKGPSGFLVDEHKGICNPEIFLNLKMIW